MAVCAYFTHAGEDCCALGVNYQQLAGGGVFRVLLRLPCLPLSDRKGEEARTCDKYQPGEVPAEQQQGEQQ